MMMVREQGLCYTAFIQQVFMEYWSIGQGQELLSIGDIAVSRMEKVPNAIGVYIVLEGNRKNKLANKHVVSVMKKK